ncbi:AdoMet dependent proline di-methyltransferase-domain-containing protein [Fomitopsis serialis]|uniref:AdoMet dependent proline di-methyltransferase-domain-containing protein n=1 Tax=Fomitopsis serialis TaxID=139415 RepID=UPI002007B2C1|nr:AdoMet dependent proline di-methyltransferase-domain-containing protein [Neoantrodia serialis]KAH9935001.1 AdoMet dependent proline di-methyltransferase-domain-containing protein [Neoantrodia serialis]
MAEQIVLPEPDVQAGIDYWASQPANYDGVLGGFGEGSLPRIDALGSRQFLLYLMPELSTVPSAIRSLAAPKELSYRTRALDVGAGVGRVTADVLLHLVSDIVLVEPVESLAKEALSRGRASEIMTGKADATFVPWKGISAKAKSVSFTQDTLQGVDPCHPSKSPTFLDRVGYVPNHNDLDEPFDIVWCQWCLGSLSDSDLVAFLQRGRSSLRDPNRSVIIVKENCCSDDDGQPQSIFDETDSSITRSDLAWKKAFKDAGLALVHEQVQRGFPEGLYTVRM